VLTPDKVTDQLRAHADAWHSTAPLSVAALAEQVRRDEIDILVDLTLHAAGNRLLMFARKPAPVQVTYLGYPSTTGMTAMDWKLTDGFLDPSGRSEQFSSERLAYLESTYWCYRQPLAEVPVSEPPLRTRGQVTFGCFNNFARVSNDAVSAWCRILAARPTSRLILHADPGEHRLRISKNMAAQGIHDDRFEFVEHVRTAKYFERHAMIDIALDPFPYCGGTTTCDALWMGVPVVSLVGDIAVRRAGLSILSRVGLAELAVDSVDAYVQMAIELASDVERLTQLRRELRDRMSASPLMDAPAFARDVERLYRQMWIDWVAANPSR
jgi:predicted O-linked N-acetylglucosamine transferase (SPINDLY family)